MKDINGIELQVGDSVVMAVTQYKSALMVKGTITKIDLRKEARLGLKLCVTVNNSRRTFTPENQILKLS